MTIDDSMSWAEQCAAVAASVAKTGRVVDGPRDEYQEVLGRAREFLARSGYDDLVPQNVEKIARLMAHLDTAGRKRGCLLKGTVAVGKTMAMGLVAEFVGGFECVQPGCPIIDADWFSEAYTARGRKRELLFETAESGRHMVIDDLGIEPRVTSKAGDPYEVMEAVIRRRYTAWKTRGAVTLVTTNLSLKEIEGRYDLRATSRLLEMCGAMSLTGPDRRNPDAVRAYRAGGG